MTTTRRLHEMPPHRIEGIKAKRSFQDIKANPQAQIPDPVSDNAFHETNTFGQKNQPGGNGKERLVANSEPQSRSRSLKQAYQDAQRNVQVHQESPPTVASETHRYHTLRDAHAAMSEPRGGGKGTPVQQLEARATVKKGELYERYLKVKEGRK